MNEIDDQLKKSGYIARPPIVSEDGNKIWIYTGNWADLSPGPWTLREVPNA